MALSGARASASTWTPKPVASGSGGRAWGLVGVGAAMSIKPARSAECGVRNAEWTVLPSRPRASQADRTFPCNSALRIPHSAFRTGSASRRVNRGHQPDLRDVQAGRLGDGIQHGRGDVLGPQHGLPLREAGLRVGVHRVPHLRVHRAGRNEGDADAGAGEVHLEHLVHPPEAELARRIGGRAGVGDVIGHGADRHDVAGAALDEMRHDGARDEEGPGDEGEPTGERRGAHSRPRPPYTSLRNSSRVFASWSSAPRSALVTVLEFCFSTPRIIMQRWYASITTPTPCGSSTSMSASATWSVSRSCTWSRRAKTSITRGILERPTRRPFGR